MQVLEAVSSNFVLSDDALTYLNDVCHKMLLILIDKPFMYTVKVFNTISYINSNSNLRFFYLHNNFLIHYRMLKFVLIIVVRK